MLAVMHSLDERLVYGVFRVRLRLPKARHARDGACARPQAARLRLPAAESGGGRDAAAAPPESLQRKPSRTGGKGWCGRARRARGGRGKRDWRTLRRSPPPRWPVGRGLGAAAGPFVPPAGLQPPRAGAAAAAVPGGRQHLEDSMQCAAAVGPVQRAAAAPAPRLPVSSGGLRQLEALAGTLALSQAARPFDWPACASHHSCACTSAGPPAPTAEGPGGTAQSRRRESTFRQAETCRTHFVPAAAAGRPAGRLLRAQGAPQERRADEVL